MVSLSEVKAADTPSSCINARSSSQQGWPIGRCPLGLTYGEYWFYVGLDGRYRGSTFRGTTLHVQRRMSFSTHRVS